MAYGWMNALADCCNTELQMVEKMETPTCNLQWCFRAGSQLASWKQGVTWRNASSSLPLLVHISLNPGHPPTLLQTHQPQQSVTVSESTLVNIQHQHK